MLKTGKNRLWLQLPKAKWGKYNLNKFAHDLTTLFIIASLHTKDSYDNLQIAGHRG